MDTTREEWRGGREREEETVIEIKRLRVREKTLKDSTSKRGPL